MRGCWESGQKVIKCIGFDIGEDHRVKGSGGTYAVSPKLSICPDPDLPAYRDRYIVRYPLRERGLDRAACGRIISAAGLPVPCKTACFFCPAMRDIEIQRLALLDHDLYLLALEMERLYRGGHHFRGDNTWSVKAVHKGTGERIELVDENCVTATSAAGARSVFRQLYKDTARPYQYKLSVSPAVVGLGRNRKWEDVPLLGVT